jgi:adenylate cyclase
MGVGGGTPFATKLRHELRTLLNHVAGYAELLLEADGDGLGVDTRDDWATASLVAVTDAAGRAVAATEEVLHPTALDRATALAAVRRALDEVLVHAGRLLEAEADESTVFDVLRIQAAARAGLALVTQPQVVDRLGAGDAGRRRPDPEDPSPEPSRGAEEERAPWTAGRTILVVDDDDANRDLLARRLSRLGYEVRTAADGGEGLAVLCDQGADLVLLDLMMPGLNGYEVLEECREDEGLRDIPVIMISARDQIDDVVECISLGAEDFLAKPIDPVLLDARVSACLEKKWLREQERALLDTVRDQAATLAEWNAGLEVRVTEQVAEIARLARLRRFLSPQVADVIVSTGHEGVLAWHRSKIAVLFCDLRGFTAFAESVEPEEVMALIGEFHDAIGSLVHRSNATVGYFSGDGLMVFFNDPLPCPDPAERAVRLAVAMRDGMAGLSSAWRTRGYDIGFGIGVTLGFATLGEIGFEGRSDYGVIGRVVNLAARLCDQAASGQILMNAHALRAVEAVVEAEDVGRLVLKGFATPVAAFNVVAVRPAAG